MNAFVGEIELFPFTFAPYGWLSCEGQILNINQYNALYALIGTQYGGDGRTTFALPNLLGTEPVPNMKYYIATEGLFPQRQ
jgi:microcystin-dependent protein